MRTQNAGPLPRAVGFLVTLLLGFASISSAQENPGQRAQRDKQRQLYFALSAAFYHAAGDPDTTEKVVEALAGGADINAEIWPVDSTALSFAAGMSKDSTTVLRLLLEKGAKVNQASAGGGTALMAGAGNTDVVRLLLKHGADATLKDRDGRTALSQAAMAANAVSAGLLIQHGAMVDAVDAEGVTPLHRAAKVPQRMLPKVVSPKLAGDNPDKSGTTVLMNAATSGQIDAVRLALERGARLTVHPRSQRTVLMFAAQRGGPDLMELLLSRGQEINAKDGEGYSAALLAEGQPALRMLVERGADVKAVAPNGDTLLHKWIGKYQSTALVS